MRFAVEVHEPLEDLIETVRTQAGMDEMTRAQVLVHLEFAQAQIEFWMEWSQC